MPSVSSLCPSLPASILSRRLLCISHERPGPWPSEASVGCESFETVADAELLELELELELELADVLALLCVALLMVRNYYVGKNTVGWLAVNPHGCRSICRDPKKKVKRILSRRRDRPHQEVLER